MGMILIYFLLFIAFIAGWKSGIKESKNIIQSVGYGIFGAGVSVLLMNGIIDLITDFDNQSLIYRICFWSIGVGFLIGIVGIATMKSKV